MLQRTYRLLVDSHSSPLTELSGQEYHGYEILKAKNAVIAPGCLGVRGFPDRMYMHQFRLREHVKFKIIQLCSPSSLFGLVYADFVRIDLANRNLILDGAFVPFHTGPDMIPDLKFRDACSETAVGIAR